LFVDRDRNKQVLMEDDVMNRDHTTTEERRDYYG